ncbi:MAG: hypothetical protein ABI927_09285, partial [Gaiellaceae bacterium]
AFAGAGSDDDDYSGRCSAILSNGKRCPNTALPGSKYCGVPQHQALAGTEADNQVDIEASLTVDEIVLEEVAVEAAEATTTSEPEDTDEAA